MVRGEGEEGRQEGGRKIGVEREGGEGKKWGFWRGLSGTESGQRRKRGLKKRNLWSGTYREGAF